MYSVNYTCSNCYWSGNKQFSYGVSAPKTTDCNRCGCYTAYKNGSSTTLTNWPENLPYQPLKYSTFGTARGAGNPGLSQGYPEIFKRTEVNPRSHTYMESK